MKYIILPLALTLFLFSCGGEESDSSSSENDSEGTTTEEVDTTTAEEAEEEFVGEAEFNEEDPLSNYFSYDMLQQMHSLQERLQTDLDHNSFSNHYSRCIEMTEELLSDAYTKNTDWKKYNAQQFEMSYEYDDWLVSELLEYNDELSPFYADCGAECAGLEIYINFEYLNDIATLTETSDIDDDFMSLTRELCGDIGWPGYISQNDWIMQWSFEESSIDFGNDALYNTLGKMTNFKIKHGRNTIFSDHINDYNERIFWVFERDKEFVQDKDAVLSELYKINDLNYFEGEQKSKFDKYVVDVENGKDCKFNAEPSW